MSKELSIILPTYDEQDNIRPLADRMKSALEGIDWEVIFVDDSPYDETADVIRNIARDDPRIRLIRRKHCEGLSSAVIEGMRQSEAPLLAVMDADLQHDSLLLKQMFHVLNTEPVDLAIGSRYVDGADSQSWSKFRHAVSRCVTQLVKIALNIKMEDPLSGFFMVRREIFQQAERKLNGRGQKILLDLYLSADTPPRFKELPYSFSKRASGKSKLNAAVLWENVCLFVDKLF